MQIKVFLTMTKPNSISFFFLFEFYAFVEFKKKKKKVHRTFPGGCQDIFAQSLKKLNVYQNSICYYLSEDTSTLTRPNSMNFFYLNSKNLWNSNKKKFIEFGLVFVNISSFEFLKNSTPINRSCAKIFFIL